MQYVHFLLEGSRKKAARVPEGSPKKAMSIKRDDPS